MDGNMRHDFSEDLREEEEDVYFMKDNVLVCFGALLDRFVKKLFEGVGWHGIGVCEFGL